MSRGRWRSRSRRSRRSRGGGRGPRPYAHRKHPLGDPSLDQVEMTEEDVDAEEEGEEEEEKARERNNEVASGGGLSMPDGHWVVHAHTKKVAYNQRFIVSGAKSGNGTYVNKGAKAQVKSDAPGCSIFKMTRVLRRESGTTCFKIVKEIREGISVKFRRLDRQ